MRRGDKTCGHSWREREELGRFLFFIFLLGWERLDFVHKLKGRSQLKEPVLRTQGMGEWYHVGSDQVGRTLREGLVLD